MIGFDTMSREELTLLKLRARAERERRQKRGGWSTRVRAMEEYQGRPVDWAVEQMGIPEHTLRWSLSPEYEAHAWDGTVDPIARMMEVVGEGRDGAVESATGVGKTFGLAVLALWFLAAHEGSLVVTAAPKKDQLLEQVWMEIGRMWPTFQKLFPDAELLTGKIRMRPDEPDDRAWSMVAFVAGVGKDEESATKAQGFHREHMLIITEETPGMHAAIMRAFSETRTDDHNVQLSVGNPDSQFDELHKFSEKETVESIRASALDHPNVVTGRRVIPGAIGKRRLAERTADLGEGTPLYDSRVRGVSPPQSSDSLIRWEWLETSAERWDALMSRPEGLEGLPALGVDVSDQQDGDPAALARWKGNVLTEVVEVKVGLKEKVKDASGLAVYVKQACESVTDPLNPRHVGVDAVGVGASTVNECRRLGLKVKRLSGGSKAVAGVDLEGLWEETETDEDGVERPKGARVMRAEAFRNLRAAVHWQLREDIRMGRVALPKDVELWRELTAIRWETKGGVIAIEEKDEIRKRLGRSPNRADAVAMGNYVRSRVPVKRQVQRVAEGNPNVDTGLEKLLARREKEQQEVSRRLMKALKLRKRGGF